VLPSARLKKRLKRITLLAGLPIGPVVVIDCSGPYMETRLAGRARELVLADVHAFRTQKS